MRRLIIRHGQTPASRLNRVLFGVRGASLDEHGIEQAIELGIRLDEMGIDKSQDVAVSELARAIETAKYAGFTSLISHPILNELDLQGDKMKIIADAAKDILPPEANTRATEIMNDIPPEAIWFSHGLVIGGLRERLEIPCSRLVPAFCEITEADF